MKSTCLILFIFIQFLTLTGKAQNWQLFNCLDKYNYAGINDSLINTIWIDSVVAGTNDTICYFNKVLDYSRVKSSNSNDTILEGVLLPSKLFNQAVIKNDDSLYFIGIDKDWLIKPFETLNDTWEFSEEVTAVITEFYQAETFGVTDSVKTIELSDGGIIKISKSFGILVWKIKDKPEIQLIGIEGKAGMRIPSFLDYYDYNTGDVFQYNCGHYIGGDATRRNYKIKYTISEKEMKGDTIRYTLNGIYRLGELFYGGGIQEPSYTESSSSFTKKSVLVNSKDFFVNKYYNELVSIDNTSFDLYPLCSFNPSSFYYDFEHCEYYSMDVKLTQDSSVVKSFITNYLDGNPSRLLKPEEAGSDSAKYCSIENEGSNSDFSFTLLPVIGVTHYFSGYWEGSEELTFVGAVISGDTIGKVNDDTYFIVSSPEETLPELCLFPNPFKDKIHFQMTEPGRIEIYDSKGIPAYVSPLDKGEHILDMQFLKPGIHLLRLTYAKKTTQTIIIKQ